MGGRGSVQLKFVKGALDKLKHARRKSVQNKSRTGLIVRNTVTLAGMAGVCYLVYKYNVLDIVKNSIQTRIKDFNLPILNTRTHQTTQTFFAINSVYLYKNLP